MGSLEFAFNFPNVRRQLQETRMVHCVSGKDTRFRVGFDDTQFARLAQNPMPAHIADLVDIAFAVAVADRLAVPHTNQQRLLEIVLPVRNPAYLSDTPVIEGLQDLLYDFTGDEWRFAFGRRTALGRTPELERHLISDSAGNQAREVALWSGGLDALAGFYSRAKALGANQAFTVYGTSSNPFILNRQREVAAALRIQANALSIARFGVVQTEVLLSDTGQWWKNHAPRARGFVFLLLGAVCAALERQQALFIYENGVGALNLPLRLSEVGLDHSRAVHPKMLRRMGHWMTLTLGQPFAFHNPFEFITKAEMCLDLITDGLFPVIAETVSCDRRRRARPMQCGSCSSCLLRRQALAANGYVEPASAYEITAHTDPERQAELRSKGHLGPMRAQVADLKADLASPAPWSALQRRYPDLADTAEEIAREDRRSLLEVREQFIRLYHAYCAEWAVACRLMEPH